MNAGGRRVCSCGAPRAPHPVVASRARWSPNAIAKWDRGHQRERRVSLPPPVAKVAWLPPEGEQMQPPPGYPPLPPASSMQQQPQAQTTQQQAAQAQAKTPRRSESERQQQQAHNKQHQAAATRQVLRSAIPAMAASALAAAIAAAADPAPAEDCYSTSDGSASVFLSDYQRPNCGGELFVVYPSSRRCLESICGCGGPPSPTAD